MKKIRQRILEIKEGFLDAKSEKSYEAFILANYIVIATITLAICYTSMIFRIFGLNCVSYAITVLAFILYIFFLTNSKAFGKVMPFSAKLLLLFFGRYGRVVTKKDWKRIKKECPKGYKEIWSKKAIGHCYYYSWAISLFLKDAELMYCSIKRKDNDHTAHAVIVKNNCVYCTNSRQHFDLEEYKKMKGVNVYKMFSEEEYRTKDFFDNIREDFKSWCAERNVYCDPQ